MKIKSADALTEIGDAERALENYQAGLAAADKSFQRVSTSLHQVLDRADVQEATVVTTSSTEFRSTMAA